MNEPLLWKDCADWLCRLQVLPDNHRILWPDATFQDLAYALRDGVLLCHVATTLHPEAVDSRSVNQRPQMAQFLCLKNIRIFLTACRDMFELQETDLFGPSMLYDYTDFARVLHTLSKLSHCTVATSKRPDIRGFPKAAGVDADVRHGGHQINSSNAQQEEDIYR
jgi:guanine nucleotide exchange factor VAV